MCVASFLDCEEGPDWNWPFWMRTIKYGRVGARMEQKTDPARPFCAKKKKNAEEK